MLEISESYEAKLKIELFIISALCISAVLVIYVGCSAFLMPATENTAIWFQRSGSITTAIAVFAQLKTSGFLEKIRGSTFAESWVYYNKYSIWQSVLNFISVVIVISGTIIWGYGDLLFKYLLNAPS